MRRNKPLRRSPFHPGGVSSRLTRRRKLAKANGARQQKRRKEYAAKLAKSRKGPGYAEAMERAGGRCEYVETGKRLEPYPDDFVALLEETVGATRAGRRCTETEDLDAHHVTYFRFGGDEMASDYLILCKRHHALIETTFFPHRKRGAA